MRVPVVQAGPASTGRGRDERGDEGGRVTRPCKFCLAAYPILFEDGDVSSCEFEHRDEQRVYDLAAAMARVFQPRPNTDEQIAWFLQDADAIVDDFNPVPAKWRLRKLPDGSDEFAARFRVNDVTYVIEDGGKEKTNPVRLSALRAAQREANREAAERHKRWIAATREAG
jgi:hypothetical protein